MKRSRPGGERAGAGRAGRQTARQPSRYTGLPSRDYHSGVVALVIDPMSPATVYVAESAGVFKSTDGAKTWQPATSGLPSTRISALAMDPRNSATLYAGTLDGVFTTTDGGQSWVALNYRACSGIRQTHRGREFCNFYSIRKTVPSCMPWQAGRCLKLQSDPAATPATSPGRAGWAERPAKSARHRSAS